MIKGGIWKNTEDEILKAAVMKYGKNQWARIASLLSRKSAKQCKSRWYEWLDPSIKKTEWSREEEEKLLHLAKIMPCQWRTIAPIVGRTAAQCLEHYEKLLDAATQKEDYDPADDPRRLRPGEIDPNPEAKPARPDQVDMEEDEKEMLQEARARLANTKGKKAKRKAREKQLEEARRLAALQKRRELKAAGISVHKRRKKKKGIDYNAEIPFHHRAAPGFYSTSSESQREVEEKQNPNFNPVSLQALEGDRRDETEEKLRKKDAQKAKSRMEKNLPEAIRKLQGQQDLEKRRRPSLNMPPAQMSETEIREISKMASSTVEDETEEEGDDPTTALLSKYTPVSSGPAAPQTPYGSMTPRGIERTPARPDSIRTEAENLRALTVASTPLMGGENVPLHPSDFSGATPRKLEVATPNPLVTPLRTPVPGIGGVTPSRGGEFVTPLRTPLRDQLNINEAREGRDFGEEEGDGEDKGMGRGEDPTKQLLKGLAALPKPSNEYKVTMPEIEDEEMDEDEEDATKGSSSKIVDAEEVLKSARDRKKEKMDQELRLRSQVLRRELPRPYQVNGAFSKPAKEIESMKGKESDLEIASELIKAEMVSMLTKDAIDYPTKYVRPPKKTGAFKYDNFTETELKNAKKLLDQEVTEFSKNFGSFSLAEHFETWEKCHEDLVYLPHIKKFTLMSLTKSDPDKIRALQYQYDTIKTDMTKFSKKAKNLATPLQVYLGGYQKVAQEKEQAIHQLHKQISEATLELSSFQLLRKNELLAIPQRIENLKKELENQRQAEVELQTRYANLIKAKNELLQEKTSTPMEIAQ
uniref:Uncharacterized protein n=1 Tax=Arcella intermedia TaxID=1963864 RepID=A0A6B2KY67_9EUKA